jgi:hypothetical protein
MNQLAEHDVPAALDDSGSRLTRLYWRIEQFIEGSIKRLDTYCRQNNPTLYALRADVIISILVVLALLNLLLIGMQLFNDAEIQVVAMVVATLSAGIAILGWSGAVMDRFRALPLAVSSLAHYRFIYFVAASLLIAAPGLALLSVVPVLQCCFKEMNGPVLTYYFIFPYVVVIGISLSIALALRSTITEDFSNVIIVGELRRFAGPLFKLGVVFIFCVVISLEAKAWREENFYSLIVAVINPVLVFPLRYTLLIFYCVEAIVVIGAIVGIYRYLKKVKIGVASDDLRASQTRIVPLFTLAMAIAVHWTVAVFQSTSRYGVIFIISIFSLATFIIIETIYRLGSSIVMGPRRK